MPCQTAVSNRGMGTSKLHRSSENPPFSWRVAFINSIRLKRELMSLILNLRNN